MTAVGVASRAFKAGSFGIPSVARSQARTVYVTNSPKFGEMSLATFLTSFKRLRPNTKVLFKAGEVFDMGDIIPNVALKFGRYGTGADPKWRGSVDVGALTWTNEGSNIWSCPWVDTPSATFQWLYFNDVAAQMSESPWYVITSQPSTTKLAATTLISAWGTPPVGAYVVNKEYYFSYSHRNTVTAYDNSTGEITLSNAVSTGAVGFSFKLFNMLQFVNTDGEFFYDSTAGKIYFRSSSGSPAGSNIRVCTKNVAVDVSGKTGSTFTNINFTQYYQNAIKGVRAHLTTIDSCNINNIRQNGIHFYGLTRGLKVKDSTFTNCEQNAAYFGALDGFTITGNTITNIGKGATLPFCQKIGPTFSFWEQTMGTGISFTWDEGASITVARNGYIAKNKLDTLSYVGFVFTVTNTIVESNEISNYLMDFVDGGGMHFINRPEYPYSGVSQTCKIRKNIFHHAYGSLDNTPGTFFGTYKNYVWGLYIDINCTAFEIDDNTIYELPQLYGPNISGGILFNYGNFGHKIRNNKISGVGECIRFVNDTINSAWGRTNTGHVMTGNVLCGRGGFEFPLHVLDQNNVSNYNPFGSGGSSDGNYFLIPYNTSGSVAVYTSGGVDTGYTLANWRTFLGQDAASVSASPSLTYNTESAGAIECLLVTNRTDVTITYTVPANYKDINNATSATWDIGPWNSALFISTINRGDFIDQFTGSSGGIAAHTPDVGGAWSLNSGTININGSGRAVATVSGTATFNTALSDCKIAMKGSILAAGAGISIIARHNGSTGGTNETYIWLAFFNNTFSISKKNVGSTTTLVNITSGVALPSGSLYQIELELIGNRAICRMNGKTLIDVTDSALNYTGTRHGMKLDVNSSNDCITVNQ